MPTIPPFDPNTPCKDKVCFANHCYQLGFPYITSSELSAARHLCSNGNLAVFASNMSKPNTYDFLQLCEVFEDTCVARVLVCVWQNAFYVHCFSLCPWREASWDVGQTTFNAWPRVVMIPTLSSLARTEIVTLTRKLALWQLSVFKLLWRMHTCQCGKAMQFEHA